MLDKIFLKRLFSGDVAAKGDKGWDSSIRTFLFALFLALVFRSFAYEPFHIPSGSMKSNLLIGDYLFVSKFSYGYSRYSFPFSPRLFSGRKGGFGKPERGDVVVFRLPSNTRIDYIKRVMGLPGDRLQVKDGIVYVNEQPLPRRYIDEFSDDENPNNIVTIPRFFETLPEGKILTVLKEKRNFPQDNTHVYIVPPGHYFMMGDNRDHSMDSRFLKEVGFVPEENIVGRADMIFFSVDLSQAHWYNPISWVMAFRGGRFFKRID